MDSKRFKRKLIFELGTGADSQREAPSEYSRSKLKWECDVIIEDHARQVNEYTISPDRKLLLNDFLGHVKKEIIHNHDLRRY
jgi:hypothetical protein